MAITSCLSLSSPFLLSISTRSHTYPPSPLTVHTNKTSTSTLHLPRLTFLSPSTTPRWRVSASPEAAPPPESTPLESAQQVVSSGDDGFSTVVSALLFIAFVILTILTIGVIYLGVTDFLGKREREKFDKEQTAKQEKKKGGKKGKAGAKAGPRGFGQKVEIDGAEE
ncbi:hypothetical protein K2173_015716 [Erythroxylum novogranatense]|uniref:Transmembrane protein n=1 Tax=Erythroxylum novogranatense TaxID=1862640 RepID=A0AAV8SEF6_9ROSI|nr:hypothetical protein K2173_015716 [Erythroxylum novogranatense]